MYQVAANNHRNNVEVAIRPMAADVDRDRFDDFAVRSGRS
jgi:hypothetical protein